MFLLHLNNMTLKINGILGVSLNMTAVSSISILISHMEP